MRSVSSDIGLQWPADLLQAPRFVSNCRSSVRRRRTAVIAFRGKRWWSREKRWFWNSSEPWYNKTIRKSHTPQNSHVSKKVSFQRKSSLPTSNHYFSGDMLVFGGSTEGIVALGWWVWAWCCERLIPNLYLNLHISIAFLIGLDMIPAANMEWRSHRQGESLKTWGGGRFGRPNERSWDWQFCCTVGEIFHSPTVNHWSSVSFFKS